ncbi:MAG: hypothetical protein OXF75_08760 [Acidimicrobiaceae bacterium]|nr:hypothetical protein [Acidimicrobiaceae bacterium]
MKDDAAPVENDWISGVVDTIVDNVDRARTHGTENAVRLVRAIVYGLVALVFAAAALTLLIIIGVRLADAYLPIGSGVGDATWAAHLFIGGLLAILGFGFWLNRKIEGVRWVISALILDAGIIIAIVCYGIIDSFA